MSNDEEIKTQKQYWTWLSNTADSVRGDAARAVDRGMDPDEALADYANSAVDGATMMWHDMRSIIKWSDHIDAAEDEQGEEWRGNKQTIHDILQTIAYSAFQADLYERLTA